VPGAGGKSTSSSKKKFGEPVDAIESADIIVELEMDDAELEGVKFQKGVPIGAGSGGQSGWPNDQYVPAILSCGIFVGQIKGVDDKSLINSSNCVSESDSSDRRLSGE
jgi:hypothetical protein